MQALDFANDVQSPSSDRLSHLGFSVRGRSGEALQALRRACARPTGATISWRCTSRIAREQELPDVGILAIEDAETGELLELDTANPQVRTRFAEVAKNRGNRLRYSFNAEAVDSLELRTGESYIPPLMNFFKTRVRRRR